MTRSLFLYADKTGDDGFGHLDIRGPLHQYAAVRKDG